MRTAPEFAADPIGVHIDPDQLVAARNAGASPEEIHQRAYAGEFMPERPSTCGCPSRRRLGFVCGYWPWAGSRSAVSVPLGSGGRSPRP